MHLEGAYEQRVLVDGIGRQARELPIVVSVLEGREVMCLLLVPLGANPLEAAANVANHATQGDVVQHLLKHDANEEEYNGKET